MKKKIAHYVKKVRKLYGMTQEEFAKLLKKDRTAVTKYESGSVTPPINVYLDIQELEQKRKS